MSMWRVHAAWVEEAGAHGESKANEWWEGLAIGKVSLAALATADAAGWVGGGAEVEFGGNIEFFDHVHAVRC